MTMTVPFIDLLEQAIDKLDHAERLHPDDRLADAHELLVEVLSEHT